MKIGITGVSSTGKSWLSRTVAERSGLPLIDENDDLALSFAYVDKQGWPMSSRDFNKMSASDNLNFQRAIMAVREEKLAKHDSYVEDGSPLLQMAYLYTHAPLLMDMEEFDEHVTRLKKMATTYDYIWYLPYRGAHSVTGNFGIENNGIRIINPHFLQKMDWILEGLITEMEDTCHIYEMLTLDREQRVKFVMKGIDEVRTPILPGI